MINRLTDEEIKKHQKNLDYYGYTVVPSYLNEDEVRHYLDLTNSTYSKTQSQVYKGVPDRDKFDKIIYGLPNKDIDFLKPIFTTTIEQILLPKLNDPFYRFSPAELPNYFLSYYNARSSGEVLDLHIDSHVPSPGSHTWSMQVVVMLESMSRANGGTVIVPGSHKSGTFTDREFKNVTSLECSAGDLIIWDSRLWHGTTANDAGKSRWALVATFSSWWVKPTMDFTRSLPQESYSRLSLKEKSLLGFCSIPPCDESGGINTKKGLNDLKKNISDYY